MAPSNLVMESPGAERAGLYSEQMNPIIMRCNLIYSVAYGLVCCCVPAENALLVQKPRKERSTVDSGSASEALLP